MVETQSWKKDIAKEFIENNITLGGLGEVKDSLESLKDTLSTLVGSEEFDDEKNPLLGSGMVDNIMKILFNKRGGLRSKTGFELNKMKNLSYYLITSDGQRKLDLLFNEMEKAKSESELKESLSVELKNLESDVENGGNDDEQKENGENGEDEAPAEENENQVETSEISENDNEKIGQESSVDNETTETAITESEISMKIDNKNILEIAHLGSNWDTRKKGEKLNVDRKIRQNFLFNNGLPKEKSEMENKYLTTIVVPVINTKGGETSLKLKVHKKLKKSFECVFKELKDSNIKIDPESTGSYVWRKMRRGKSMSEHSYGSAIDINWNVNGGVYGKTDENSELFNSQKTVEIFKKYGFAWGGDWSKKSNDPMHFSYMGS